MKRLIKIGLVLTSSFFVIISCDDNDTVILVEENNIFGVVSVGPFLNQEFHYSGNLITNRVCELDLIVLNMDTVLYAEPDGYHYSNDNNGNINFRLNEYEYTIPIADSVHLEIHTGVGMIKGNGIIPDTAKNITFSLVDTVEINETLTISYSGKADYYWIHYGYRYLNEDTTWISSKSGNIYTTENEIYFDSTFHPKNGYLILYSIRAVNGPLPEINALPNMDGEGKGYLYFLTGQEIDVEFVIGEGFDFP